MGASSVRFVVTTKVKPSDGGAQNAEYWAKTGLTLTYSLTNSNKYSDSKTFTVTAENGTTRTFTVTVKKITDADRTYKIAVSNISGGAVTAPRTWLLPAKRSS